jgi:protein-S-isoprenylcysteine O-methyltransferase Ste14
MSTTMTTMGATPPQSAARPAAASAAYRTLYKLFAYFGLFSIFGALVFGFRHDPMAPAGNYGINILLYAAFVVPHLIMTRSWWKRLVSGNPAGSPRERRLYITITVVTWLAILALQRPLPGPAVEFGNPTIQALVAFAGYGLFLWAAIMFFEGVTTAMIDGLLGVPGSVSAYSHGVETPLFTDGPYARVRHPMYRAAILAGLCSLLIHPNVAQLFWAGLIGGTFLAFIPVEEAQMIRARGDDYRQYQQRTPWRLFRGVW